MAVIVAEQVSRSLPHNTSPPALGPVVRESDTKKVPPCLQREPLHPNTWRRSSSPPEGQLQRQGDESPPWRLQQTGGGRAEDAKNDWGEAALPPGARTARGATGAGRQRSAGATIGVCVGGREGSRRPGARGMGVRSARDRLCRKALETVPGRGAGGGAVSFPAPSCRPTLALPRWHMVRLAERQPASSPPWPAATAGAHPSPTTTHLMACICPGSEVGWDGGARLPSSASFAKDAARSRSARASEQELETESQRARASAGRGRGQRRSGRREAGSPAAPPRKPSTLGRGVGGKEAAPRERAAPSSRVSSVAKWGWEHPAI